MKLYYIANASMPHKKAYAIQLAKMCEAFIEAGVELELLIPSYKSNLPPIDVFYKLKTPIVVKKLPAFDFYSKGPIRFFLSGLSFMVSYSSYLLFKIIKGERGIIYTIEMDTFSFIAIPFFGMPFLMETHGGKAKNLRNKFFFKKISGIISTNDISRDQIVRTLNVRPDIFIVEPNGVDLSLFKKNNSVTEARMKLNLPKEKKIAMYCGRFYKWKGLQVLAEAASSLPGDVLVYLVGGSKEEFISITGVEYLPDNMIFIEGVNYTNVSLWLEAADCLLVLGTSKDVQSFQYTSPMKIFEYMAIGKPIVASNTPAIRNIVNEKEVFFYEPDDPNSLRERIISIFKESHETIDMVTGNAYKKVQQWTWDRRAERVINFIEEKTFLKLKSK